MGLNIEKNREIQDVIKELTSLNEKIERLLEKVPTSDSKILAQLDSYFNNLPRLLYAKTTVEKGTMLYEQAVGKAMSLKERYNYKLNHGGLRKMKNL